MARAKPFELVFVVVSAWGFALFIQQDIGQLRKGLELSHKCCISVIEIRWKLQLVGFSYDEKSANVVMWKDKEYEYISRTWNKQQWGAHHSSLAKCQPKRILKNRVRCRSRLLNQHSFQLNLLVIYPWFDLWYVFVRSVFEAATGHN